MKINSKSFLDEFFYEVEKENLNYCVVGKTFSNFNICKDGDIDIIFSNKDLGNCLDLIKRLTKKKNIYLLNCIRHSYKSYYLIIYDNRFGRDEFHKLDICSDYKPHKGRFEIIESYFLLKNKRSVKFTWQIILEILFII